MSFIKNTLLTATVAAVGTTIAALAMGQQENGDPAAPLNATSHILWGDEAAEQDGFSVRYTLVGVALNASAMLGWAALQELAFGRWAREGSPARALATGSVTSAVAYVTDYHVVPERLTPGLEKRLSPEALTVAYVALAAMLAIGARKGR